MYGPIIGIIATFICGSIAVINFIATHRKKGIATRILGLSYTVSILVTLGSLSMTLSYFVPRINGRCICQELYISSMSLYIIALYLIKLTYLQRAKILNLQPVLSYFLYQVVSRGHHIRIVLLCIFTLRFGAG